MKTHYKKLANYISFLITSYQKVAGLTEQKFILS